MKKRLKDKEDKMRSSSTGFPNLATTDILSQVITMSLHQSHGVGTTLCTL